MKVAKLADEDLRLLFDTGTLSRAEGSVGQLYDCRVKDGDLYGKIKGNHGVYNPCFYTSRKDIDVSCTCKSSASGPCKHVAALGLTYIYTPWVFVCEDKINRGKLNSLDELKFYTAMTQLKQFIEELKDKGISLSALSDITRLPVQHISSVIKDNERGIPNSLTYVLKLACLYLIDNVNYKI